MSEGSFFRYAIGVLVILGGMLALGGLYFVAIPEANKEPLLLAIGIVLGWGGSVVTHEYGNSRNSAVSREQVGKAIDLAKSVASPKDAP